MASLVHLAPPLGIFLLVVGSIYAGLATPTEAAALGVLGALVLAAWYRRLTWNMLREAVEGTMRSTAMIMLIVIAASFLNFVMSATGLTDALTQSITGLGLSPGWMLLIVIVFYLVLGCFMETLSMMITTIPIVAPIMIGLGYDPIWLGIVIIILVEAALITPPVGLNLFVVQSLRKSGSMGAVIVGSLPFVLAMAVMLALLAWWPDVALWLPRAFGWTRAFPLIPPGRRPCRPGSIAPTRGGRRAAGHPIHHSLAGQTRKPYSRSKVRIPARWKSTSTP